MQNNTPRASLWQALKDALNGTEADYTQINLNRAIFLLAIPMILELVMESTFAVVDIFFVSQLGASAIATVGLTETFMFLLYSIAGGLATAATAIIARRIGEKKPEEAGLSAVQAVVLALLASVPFAVAGIFFPRQMLLLMGADPWTLQHGYVYAQWMLGGNAVIMLLFVMNAVFRGAGDAAIAMRILWIANAVNIMLDPLLIFGWGPIPALGIEGAAIATTTGRAAGVALQVYYLLKGSKHICIVRHQFTVHTATLLHILKTSLGGIGQSVIATTSWVLLMRILADISSQAVAGATITIRMMMFTLMPAWGFSNAAATLVGQNLGAAKPERAERTVWIIGLYNMIFLIAISLLYFFCNRELMLLFTRDSEVVDIGAEWLKILSYSYFVYGWWMVAVQAFNGAGDTHTPTRINLVFFWLIQIPLSWYLANYLQWQHSGVFWGVFISETSVGLFTLWLFTRGKWKTFKV
ncbi:MAG: MATE family efflux transporter [Cyclobacteriaceae bacterium]|nr:MAG: MATE family efflux transporter [Cyclobacteriaceae bacterium]